MPLRGATVKTFWWYGIAQLWQNNMVIIGFDFGERVNPMLRVVDAFTLASIYASIAKLKNGQSALKRL